MMARPGDTTLDLFSWEPPQLVKRFAPEITRGASIRSMSARAVSAAMKDSGKTRAEIAEQMSDILGEDITENMLNAYASEAKEAHTIPHHRLHALALATLDPRLLQPTAEAIGCAVIDERYLPWVEVGQLADKKDEIDRAFDATRRAARRGMR
ncbi:Phage-related DNA transposition protein(B) [uncultured Alphaproteobacteria bacterium]|uniref:Phage-related DNA transposition protein(B) n=1 Tax=uncultured Alphaproteobacteria bacterium TaxID=91750 RepID=A0A212KMX3_9PROT|nr:Phage-related DNA transposition protein(B) [uncultured Alphaproteobacteria bacterium]